VSFASYVDLVRQRIRLVVAIVLLATGLGAFFAYVQAPVYKATVRVQGLLPAPGTTINPLVQQLVGQTDFGTESAILAGTDVAERVRSALHLTQRASDLLDHVTVVALPGTALIDVTVTQDSPVLSTALVNAFADQYIAFRRDQTLAALALARTNAANTEAKDTPEFDRLLAELSTMRPGTAEYNAIQDQLSALAAEIASVRGQLVQLADISAVAKGWGRVITRAERATAVRESSPARQAVFGTLLGIPLGVAAALLVDTLSPRVRSRAQAEMSAGVEMLGSTPLVREAEGDGRSLVLHIEAEPLGRLAEAFRGTAHALWRVAQNRGVSTVLVTSAISGDGRSTTAAGLGLVLSEAGLPVALIDADLRRPKLDRLFGMPGEPGLHDVLVRGLPPGAARVPIRAGLSLIPAGARPERPDLVLGRHEAMAAALDQIAALEREQGAGSPLILVKSSPVVPAAEVLNLLRVVGGVLLVARWNHTPRDDLARAAELIRQEGGTLLGVVMVGVGVRARLVVEAGPIFPGGPRASAAVELTGAPVGERRGAARPTDGGEAE